MNSLIQRANSSNYTGASEKKTHWKYDWYTTSRPDTSSGSHGNTNGDNGRVPDLDSKKHIYKFKMWLKSDSQAVDDSESIEESDLFNMSTYSTTATNGSSNSVTRPTAEGARNNSLTVEDIRGAVGNSESMIALSSAGTSAPSVTGKSEASSSKPDEGSGEKPDQVAKPEEAETKDAEGDLAME